MNYLTRIGGIAAAALFAMMLAAPAANAQATRTWISGVGDDANPCSRTAPCKTFAGAISKTATGGEIDCLDPGGFGALTVTKSITLDCGGGIGGQVGSILATNGNGITINVAGGAVKIRNLTIHGLAQGSSSSLSGIRFLNGAALIVEHVGIFSFGGTAGSNGGVDFEPGFITASANGKLLMLDVEVQNGLADGVLIKPSQGATANVTLNRVSAMNNGGSGVRIDHASLTSGNGTNATIFQSELSGNAAGLTVSTPTGSVNGAANVTNSVISGNSLGMVASGAGSAVPTIRIGGNTVTGNVTGAAGAGTGVIKSFGDNYFAGNTTDFNAGQPVTPNLNRQ